MHSTDNLDDGYLGSGKQIRHSINKYGVCNHKIERLEFFDTRKILKEREIEIVNEELLNDPLCMNLQLGGGGGFINKEHALKFHQAGGRKVFQMLAKKHIEKLKNDSKYRERYSLIMSKAQSSEKNGFYNKKHTEESKRKIGIANSVSQKGNKNSQFGTCWICRNDESKKIKKEYIDSFIQNGWVKGRNIKI